METAVSQWLRCCATSLKVAGSIPDGVIGIFHWHNSSDRAMALGSTQPLTEMSPRGFLGGKCDRCVRLTTLPPSCAFVMKSGNLNFLEPSGPLQACNGTTLPLKELDRENFQGVNTTDILNYWTIRRRLSSETWTWIISRLNRVFELWHRSVMNVKSVYVVCCQYVSIPSCQYFNEKNVT